MGYPIYHGEVKELEGQSPYGDGECVALVQQLTSAGPTLRWRPGQRVVDLSFLNPGAVIANFVFDGKGVGRFPNKHGYHAALFVEFGPRNMTTGRPSQFQIMDQWNGRKPNTVHERSVVSRGDRSFAEGNPYHDCDNADQYYVVMV
jgi:hypothetical protein